MKAKSFEDLLVWQKAHAFVLEIYRLTDTFPKSELFALTSQMRRAAISIPANIAEGFKKRTRPDKIRVLNIAQGSLEESQYYRILTRELDEVSKMLDAYVRAIERNSTVPRSSR
jgi:four helix bundle protein